MDRHWLLTWTAYGRWLPGDHRGFVSNIADEEGVGTRHNTPGTACDSKMPALQRYARSKMLGSPISFHAEHATTLLTQFQETAEYRAWLLVAVAIMENHVHLIAGVPGDPDPEDLMRDFKSYGSRLLNRRWSKPASGTWWTESGSKRILPSRRALLRAIAYVRDQPSALLVYIAPGFDLDEQE